MDGIDRKIPAKRLNILGRLRDRGIHLPDLRLQNRFEYQIGMFGLGILIYFALPFEPDMVILSVGFAFLGLFWLMIGRKSDYSVWWLFTVVFDIRVPSACLAHLKDQHAGHTSL